MKNIFYFVIAAVGTVSLVCAGCPAVCDCPAGSPVCPPGVSTVPDGCGCCKVCAAQLNEDCHATQPCDHHKGLECNYGNDVTHDRGICRAKLEGRTCEYSGRMYQSGESFRAGCQHQCTCVDGAVGCAPLCPAHLPLAMPFCPTPHLIRVPGQCCPRLDCHNRKPGQSLMPRHPYKPDNSIDNELLAVGKKWDKKREHKHLAAWMQVARECVIQTTEWSPCSRSCGMGVSSRVTNNNRKCRLVKETRLCNIRPCSHVPGPLKKGRKCSRTHKPAEPMRLLYAGCRSVRLYQPNYCGTCMDGHCCSPRHTRTATVLFMCPDGERFQKAVMFVRSCKCGVACEPLNEASMVPRHWLHGDMHNFAD